MIERHLEDADFPTCGEDARGLLDPLALDIGEERLAGEREEDPVKMKRGEGGYPGQPGEGQRLGQPLADVVDDAIDTLFVLGPGGLRSGAVPTQSPPPPSRIRWPSPAISDSRGSMRRIADPSPPAMARASSGR